MKRMLALLLAAALVLSCAAAEVTAPKEIVLGNITFAMPDNSTILTEKESDGMYETSGNLGDALKVFALQQMSLDAQTVESLRTTHGEEEMLKIFAGEQLAEFEVTAFDAAYPAAKGEILCLTTSCDIQFLGGIPSSLSLALFLEGTVLTVLFVLDMSKAPGSSAKQLAEMIAPMMAAE